MQNLKNYEIFLENITSDFNKLFYNQKEFIYCKEGCSYCCERGDFPISQIEYDYMSLGFEKLDETSKNIIKQNIKNLKNSNKESYVCPYLINHRCSIYNNRPIVCRTFGLLTEDAKGNPSFPFCASMGLNYSKFYDEKTKHLSINLSEYNGINNLPKIFCLSNKVVINLPLAKKLNIDFGEQKRMIDFL